MTATKPKPLVMARPSGRNMSLKSTYLRDMSPSSTLTEKDSDE